MRQCSVLRVFTRGDEGGNHLGVVTDVAGLDGSSMQEIAAELGYSETIFIDRRRDVVDVRIFTPAAELPFAGHPLVGAAWTVGSTATGLQCGIGEVRFSADADGARIEFPVVTEVTEATDGAAVAAAAGLEEPARSWWAQMPIPYLVLEYDDPVHVASARPNPERLAAGPSGRATYLIAPAGAGRIKARFFAPVLGVFEDPATGSAAAALAAVRNFAGVASGAVAIDQGDEIGRPSTIEVAWEDGVCRLRGSVRHDEVRDLDW